MPTFTEKAIMETFIELLGKYPLDRITVKDIVSACGISRNTFYYHYQDIYDLLAKVFENETARVVKRCINENIDWQHGFLIGMDFAIENKKAIFHIYNSISKDMLEDYLYNITDSIFKFYVEKVAADADADEDDKRFIIDFYKYSLVGMALDWVKSGMKTDPLYIVQKLQKLFEGNIVRAMNRSVESKNSKNKV